MSGKKLTGEIGVDDCFYEDSLADPEHDEEKAFGKEEFRHLLDFKPWVLQDLSLIHI